LSYVVDCKCTIKLQGVGLGDVDLLSDDQIVGIVYLEFGICGDQFGDFPTNLSNQVSFFMIDVGSCGE
jgi:hypothetical protein